MLRKVRIRMYQMGQKIIKEEKVRYVVLQGIVNRDSSGVMV